MTSSMNTATNPTVTHVRKSPVFVPNAVWPPTPPNAPDNPDPRFFCNRISPINRTETETNPIETTITPKLASIIIGTSNQSFRADAGVNDTAKVVSFQTRAAHQCTVDIGTLHQGGRIVRLHAASVLDANLLRR